MGISVPLDWNGIVNKPSIVNTVNGASGAVSAVSLDQTSGAVGSYCLARSSVVVGVDATVSGASLSPVSLYLPTSTGSGYSLASGTLTGTWRCCGYSAAANSSTLFQRIA